MNPNETNLRKDGDVQMDPGNLPLTSPEQNNVLSRGETTPPSVADLELMRRKAKALDDLIKTANAFIDNINNFSPEHKMQMDASRQDFEDALTAAEAIEAAQKTIQS